MTSPFLPYVNSYLLLSSLGVPSVVNGRVTVSSGPKYLVECYLKRQDSTGTTTGGDKYLEKQSGVSGSVFLYRGYALRYVQVSNTYDIDSSIISSSYSWTTLSSDNLPNWFVSGATGRHRQGNEQSKHVIIESSAGEYGGTAIDSMIRLNVGGIPITISSGEVLN